MMNKIKIVGDIPVKVEMNGAVEYRFEEKEEMFGVNRLIFKILKNTNLTIDCKGNINSKLELVFEVLEGVQFKILDTKKGSLNKVQYKFHIQKEAKVEIYKFYEVEKMKEWSHFYLEGKKAKIDYHFKSISTKEEKYDILVYHRDSDTESNIINHGVTLKEGMITFNVSSFVPNGKKNCIANQNNRIMNLNEKLSQINPNLYIDEFDVIANHSAYISKFNENEMFYMRRLGIPYHDAEYLLTKSFLIQGMDQLTSKIEKAVNKYWR